MTAGKIKLPSLTDLKHLADYVVYRITRSNVGPWGRSGATESRRCTSRPTSAFACRSPRRSATKLTGVISGIEESDDVTSVSDMAYRFPPPDRMNASTGQADGSSDLITAVVNLVATGPVPLGAYTPAEIAAVGGMVDWLEQESRPEPMAEAVRSLAARDLITTEPAADQDAGGS
jgi:hypothetical protein